MNQFLRGSRVLLIFIIVLIFFKEGISQNDIGYEELQQNLAESIKKKDNKNAAIYSYEIAKIFWEEKKTEKAVENLSICLAYSKKAGDSMMGYLAFQHLGAIYKNTSNFSKSLDSYQKGLKLAQTLKNLEYINESLINVAESFAQAGKFKKAIEPLEEALSLALQQNNLPLQQKCYELLAGYYKKAGNNSKSIEYKNLHANLVASKQAEEYNVQQLKELEQKIISTSTEKQTVQSKLIQETQRLRQAKDSLLATKYTLEEKESSLKETESSLQETKELSEKRQLEINLLSKDKELAEMQIKEQNSRLEFEAWIRYSIIAGLLMASAFIIVVTRSYKKTDLANKEIEKQNKNIKSSINYAKRIQEAMLPKEAQKNELMPDSFILFKPRDVVSGDFYWMTEIKSWYGPDVVFAAADCTGHGVPGAFMSLIGMNALNGIISKGNSEPNQILDELDKEIRNALQQELTGNNDGMDIALCIYRKEKNLIEFSGAKNPLIYIQNNELFHIKGDVHSIGGHKPKQDFSYKKHLVSINQPTTLYMFSDGYRDQFSGNNEGKFMSKRLNRLLLDIHSLPLAEQEQILEKTFEDWKSTGPQTDDVLVMGINFEPVG